MKNFYFFLFVAILTYRIIISAQTFTDPPGPENVLVVYNINHPYSESIKN
jgi:hypothetical protein